MLAGVAAGDGGIGRKGTGPVAAQARAGARLEEVARASGERPHSLIKFLLAHNHLVPLDGILTEEQARLINEGYTFSGAGTPAATPDAPLVPPRAPETAASRVGIVPALRRFAESLGWVPHSHRVSPAGAGEAGSVSSASAQPCAAPLQAPAEEPRTAAQRDRESLSFERQRRDEVARAAEGKRLRSERAGLPGANLAPAPAPVPSSQAPLEGAGTAAQLDRERLSFQRWRDKEIARITTERRLLDERAEKLARREARLASRDASVETEGSEAKAPPLNPDGTGSTRREMLQMPTDREHRENRLEHTRGVTDACGLRWSRMGMPEGGVTAAPIAELSDAVAAHAERTGWHRLLELGYLQAEVCPCCGFSLLDGDTEEGGSWEEDDDGATDPEPLNGGRGMRPSMARAIHLCQGAELALEDVTRARAELAQEKGEFRRKAEAQSLELELLLAQAGDLVDRCEEQLGRLRQGPRTQTSRPPLPVAKELAWELLPPGTWTLDDIMKHYRRYEGAEAGRRVDYNRIRELQKLNPRSCYVGRKGWDGYFVMTFAHSQRVVLDCPMEGNAIYVLPKAWEQLTGLSKHELREQYPRLVVKIVHKAKWLGRVRKALHPRRRDGR